MVLISHKYKFIYIKNRKVAGSSIQSFFGKYCINPKSDYNYKDGIDNIDEFGIIGSEGTNDILSLRYPNNWKGHKLSEDIKRDLGEKIFNEYLKFCVIRNPYDKMVSLFHYSSSGSKKGISFKEFVKNTDCNNLHFHSIDGKSICDYYIRYENLEEDITRLCKILKIDSYDLSLLPKHKSTQRNNKKHWSEYYDDETKEIVFNKHKKEFELFDYNF
jgi:hypothetical protein